MKWLSKEELAKYYGKKFEEISAIDSPKDYYMVGQDEFECPECGEMLRTECREAYFQRSRGQGTGEGGFVGRAYCRNCQIEFKRNRTPVSEDVNYQYAQYRTDEREEYVCQDCKRRHAITTPDSTFEYIVNPVIESLESGSIRCPCGVWNSINSTEFDAEIECSSCSRTFLFSVRNEE